VSPRKIFFERFSLGTHCRWSNTFSTQSLVSEWYSR